MFSEPESTLRLAVVTAAQAMFNSGLSPGKSGNVSSRINGGMLITPSGLEYAALSSDKIVFVSDEGKTNAGSLKPSSEWHFHLAIYQAFENVSAIVHTHSEAATALACTGRDIPAFHYMVAVAGGHNIPCAPYATFGTELLANHVIEVLQNRSACLLANHGVIACGNDTKTALALATEVEVLAQQYTRALSIGDVKLLGDDEMTVVQAKFKNYGQQS